MVTYYSLRKLLQNAVSAVAKTSFANMAYAKLTLIVAAISLSTLCSKGVEVDNKSTFESGKFIFRIGKDVGNGNAWLVGVKKGVSLTGEITIPGSATTNNIKYTVTRIGPDVTDTSSSWWYNYEPAIADHPGLTKVNIPSTISDIGTFEFLGCPAIEEFHVNASNTEFKDDNGILLSRTSSWGEDYDLFRMPPATKKTKYTVPKELVAIRNNAFADNRSIKTLIITDNVHFASYWANRNLGIKEIDVSASKYYDSLDGVIYLSEEWSVDNVPVKKYERIVTCPPGLVKEKLILPNSAKYCHSGAFICTNIPYIEIPESFSSMGHYSFYKSALKALTLNTDNFSVQHSDFLGLCADCTMLERVELNGSPGKKLTIANSMFRGCANLKEITISSDKVTIESHAFRGCTSLTSFPFAKVNGMEGYNYNEISLQDGYQFAYSGLTSARIPSTLWFVPTGCFMGSALKSVNLNPSGKDNLDDICAYAFKDCHLTQVDIAQVTTLGEECFAGNPLTKVVFPDNVNLGEYENHSLLVDDSFTPDGNTWFYVGDNMVNWDTPYDWQTGKDTQGLHNAIYVTSYRKCNNVPNNFRTVYGPAGCHNHPVGWANVDLGEVKEIFTMNPVKDKLAVIINASPESPELEFEVNSVYIDGKEAVCDGDMWSIDDTGIVENRDRIINFAVNGVKMQTLYPAGYSTAVESIEADSKAKEIEMIYTVQGTRSGNDIDSLGSGIYIVTYTDGTNSKIIVK